MEAQENIVKKNNKHIMKIVGKVVWMLIGIATIVLFGAALQLKNNKSCAGVKVEITGVEEHLFIDEKDVLQIINDGFHVMSKEIGDIDLRSIELALKQTPWVKHAELFFDNQQILQVKLVERQPIARVFTVQNNSFYVDSTGLRLPLSEKLSAKVPMFTNFPSNNTHLAKPDSTLLQQVVAMGKYIVTDSFFNAQIAQIDINTRGNFELIPTIGNHVVLFGSATQIEQKFGRLFTFYKKAWLQNGWNTYEKLDLQYNNQVVATKKGTANALVDSAKAALAFQNVMMGDASFSISDSSKLISVEFNGVKANTAVPKKDSVASKVVAKLPIKKQTEKKLSNKAAENNKITNKTLSTLKNYKSVPIKKVPKAVMASKIKPVESKKKNQ